MASRILILGAAGGLGAALSRGGWPHEVEVKVAPRSVVDITSTDEVSRAMSNADLVINAAAYTRVDAAESDEDTAYAVNAEGPRRLAERARQVGAKLIHVSTDYVFDGSRPDPYDEQAALSPLGVYGASKAAGEEHVRNLLPEHLILRTSWVFGPHGNNFVRTMVRLMRERDSLSVVDDQHGCPTPTTELARCIRALALRCLTSKVPWGTYHLAGSPPTTWYGFSVEISTALRKAGVTPASLRPITSREYPTTARRPQNSVLDCSLALRTFGLEVGPWKPAMQALVNQLLSES